MANATWHTEAGDRLKAACRTRIARGMRGAAEDLSRLAISDHVVYFVVIFLDTEVEWRHTIIGIATDGARLGGANGEVASGALLAGVVKLGRVGDGSVAIERKLSHITNEWAGDGHVAETCLAQVALAGEDKEFATVALREFSSIDIHTKLPRDILELVTTLGVKDEPLGFITIVSVLDRYIAVILIPRVECEGLVLSTVWRSVVCAVECDVRRLWLVATEVSQSNSGLVRRRSEGKIAIITRGNSTRRTTSSCDILMTRVARDKPGVVEPQHTAGLHIHRLVPIMVTFTLDGNIALTS